MVLHGEFNKIESGGEQREAALTEFFTLLFKGESPTIETRGLDCSIPLYRPAIEAIRLFSNLDVFREGENSSGLRSDGPSARYGEEMERSSNLERREENLIDINNNNNNDNSGVVLVTPFPARNTEDKAMMGFAILRSMELVEMELIPNPNDDAELAIRGRLKVIFANPLGSTSLIEIPRGFIKGKMCATCFGKVLGNPAGVAGLDGKGHAEGTMAEFEGTLESSERSQAMLSDDGSLIMDTLGKMSVNLQIVYFNTSLILVLTDKGQEFQIFVKYYISEPQLVLSLFDVQVNLSTYSSLGYLELREIPMDRELSVKGFGGLKGR